MNTKPSPPQADKAPLKNLSIITLDYRSLCFFNHNGERTILPNIFLMARKEGNTIWAWY